MLCTSLMRPHERMTFRHDDAAEENYDQMCLRTQDHRIRRGKRGNGRSC